jgi:hypothetical protein
MPAGGVTTGSGSYSGGQYDDNYPDGIEHHYWNLARNRLVHEALELDRPDDVVLDIGCGRGIVVDYLRRRGVDSWGCETADPRPLNDRVAPYLFLRRDARALSDAFSGRVHTLMLLDVLEHVDDPAGLLVGCRARFANARRIVITVPARAELWTNYDDHFGHRRRYDLAAVSDLAACVAPEQVDARYFFHALYPPMRATALLGVRRPVQVTAPSGALARAAHRLLAAGFRLDERFLPGALPGSSIVAVVRL